MKPSFQPLLLLSTLLPSAALSNSALGLPASARQTVPGAAARTGMQTPSVPAPIGTATPPVSTTAADDVPTGAAGPLNLYKYAAAGHLSPAVAGIPARVYVPNGKDATVSVIDPATFRVIRTFKVDQEPQHVVPGWDLRTLWVASDKGRQSLTPIDPRTGLPGKPVPTADPYNLYFTPDGQHAIVVAENQRRLDFADPHTMKRQYSIAVPCMGVNHMDFSADGSWLIAACEFSGDVLKINLGSRSVVGKVHVGGMPQDVKVSPDGQVFYVADMMANGVYLFSGNGPSSSQGGLKRLGFIATGAGTHGLYPSRDATRLYISNRGEGTVSVLDFATHRLTAKWRIPGGGSPDMGSVSADGRQLWLSGRYSDEVYVFDTVHGQLLRRVKVGRGPHGLTFFPQPGRYSLGHTGVYR